MVQSERLRTNSGWKLSKVEFDNIGGRPMKAHQLRKGALVDKWVVVRFGGTIPYPTQPQEINSQTQPRFIVYEEADKIWVPVGEFPFETIGDYCLENSNPRIPIGEIFIKAGFHKFNDGHSLDFYVGQKHQEIERVSEVGIIIPPYELRPLTS